MVIVVEFMDLGICYIGGIWNDLDIVVKCLFLFELIVLFFGLIIGVLEMLNGVKLWMFFENILSENYY